MAEPQQQQQQKDDKEEQKQNEEQQQQKEEKQQEQKPSKSPRRQAKKPSRHNNKLYRAPPTPDNDALFERERTFVLDSRVVSSISEDYSRANPKVGSVVPPYNAQKDSHVKPYFDFIGVKQTLKKNRQEPPGTCIEGPAIERFFTSGHGMQYLTPRNRDQANGYSNEERMGHGKLWRHPNPRLAQYDTKQPEFQGYNGRFGYRRTTPGLRQEPSPFGVNTETPIY